MKPVKSNMEPENGGFLEKEIPFGNQHGNGFPPCLIEHVKK